MQFERYMLSVAAAVHNDVVPVVTENYPRHRVELAETMLLRLAADAAGGFGKEFVAEIAKLPGGMVGAQAPQALGEALDALAQLAPSDETAIEKGRVRLARTLAENSQAIDRSLVLRLTGAIAKAENASRVARESAIAEMASRLGHKAGSAEELAVSADQMSDYLRRRFGREDCRAMTVKPIPGGRSKGTILLDARIGQETHSFVIRKDFSKNFMGSMVKDEFPVIRAAFDAGIKVPEPLWLEEDAGILNGQFIVFERIAGGPAGTMFDIMAGPGVIRDYAGQLARMHRIDVAATGLDQQLKFGDSEAPVAEMVRQSYAKHRANTPDELLLEVAHQWLLANLDCVSQRRALVHGDAGFHNVLYDGDRMTGLLDWELAHVGDAAEDLMKCRAAASQVIPWEEFMQIYTDHGGEPTTPLRDKFFTVWRLVDFSLYAADARAMFESGEDSDLRLAAVGYNTFSRLQGALAAALARD
ncbi:phosphotransferase [Sphingobium sp. JS3065]|uniref:phosphotransferase family protein n=1 Tax=Sphingobium sp. JS3065 TaxID=2970925 RepID=UPI0022653EB4|nr:phosphotransferase [Sphingobium sp. JS3065]UZW57507.1 phosphotransferase [Sphingobium sp. JS3065]